MEHDLLDGRYRLGEVVGHGGAATVYAAVDVLLGRDVAVKVVRPASSRTDRYRFAAEARLLAGLSHPGLVTVHDVCFDGERPYLVMGLVTGSTLRELMDLGPMEPACTARIGARIAEALAYIHGRDIVHRDIKPANLLVDEAGTGYLADFGIARALGAAHLTEVGELVGTAAYLAPEQVTEVDIGPEADVYALGLVLLECLTGRPEYTGTTVEAAVARLSRAPRIGTEVPPPWRPLLTAMTARDPEDRPNAGYCAEVLALLASDPDALVAAVPVSGRRRVVQAGVALTALVCAIVFGVSAGPPSSVPGVPTGASPTGVDRPAGKAGPLDRPGSSELPAGPPVTAVSTQTAVGDGN